MMGSPTDILIPLPDGSTVPAEVAGWLFDAEGRGLKIGLREDGRLLVSPRSRISPSDDRFLRENRDHVRACVQFIARAEAQPD
jgi:hypothetical protein